MKNYNSKTIVFAFALLMLASVGCSRYAITTDLEEPLHAGTGMSIGAILDDLPADTPEENKPTYENIDYFKEQLAEQIEKKDIFAGVLVGHDNPDYELTGSILEYKKGSGFMRFIFGMGIGAAKVTISLTLTDKKTGEIVFGGNYTGSVTSEFSKGDKMFENVAKDFAKSLDKSLKKYGWKKN